MAKKKSLAEKLRDLAKEADEKAERAISMDNSLDAYFQGERDAFNKAAKLAQKEFKK